MPPDAPSEPYGLTLAAAARAIAARELSPVELTESVLGRIEAVDGRLNAYAAVTADRARAAAAAAEREIAAGGPRSPLHGIPVGLKDLFDVAGLATGAGSRVREGHRAAEDSAVAARLFGAGAVLTGKTQTHEFAYGLTTPQTRNPWDPDRVAGGSSGGSAVAVASGAATFALGTDTGGSIRVPAALNGMAGLKPTYGLVSRHGVTALCWSLDHVGPITRSVEDAALVLDVLAGHDPRDPASSDRPPPPYARELGGELDGLRVGVPVNYYFERTDPQVSAAVRRAVEVLCGLGAVCADVRVPMAEHIRAVQWGLTAPEATAYHERTLRASPELYGAEVRTLLQAGALVPAGDYLRAQRARALMRRAWQAVFDAVDVVAAPAVPCTAAGRGRERIDWPDGTSESVADAYVRLSAPANIVGAPALTVPVGCDDAGLPIGMQLIGRPFGDATVLRAGAAYERARGEIGRLAPCGTAQS
ncbi:amidase [Streptomyces sp. PR69]|uniref:amidase n=1 Tax=Streptomyces sp. PR69 TaxID=2984950 RepID=UPI002265291C|nr:amidase family protein [Streptomyces sp. PR69]